MPGGFPIGLNLCNANNAGAVTSTSLGTAITSGSANTKGSWVQLTASLASDCCWINIDILFDAIAFGAGPQSASVDIGIGAGGSEIVLIADLLISPAYTVIGVVRYSFPIHIPAGTRVSARAQATSASAVLNVLFNTFDGSFAQQEGYPGIETVGFSSGSTLGTAVTPNATANTLGSYAQITASTTRDYVGIFLHVDNQGTNTNWKVLLDLAIGGAGSELVILPQMQILMQQPNTGSNSCAVIPWKPISTPSGTRIAARCQSSATSSPAIGVTVYGVF